MTKSRNHASGLKQDRGESRAGSRSNGLMFSSVMERHQKTLMDTSGMKPRGDRFVGKELDMGRQQRPAKETRPSSWVSELIYLFNLDIYS